MKSDPLLPVVVLIVIWLVLETFKMRTARGGESPPQPRPPLSPGDMGYFV